MVVASVHEDGQAPEADDQAVQLGLVALRRPEAHLLEALLLQDVHVPVPVAGRDALVDREPAPHLQGVRVEPAFRRPLDEPELPVEMLLARVVQALEDDLEDGKQPLLEALVADLAVELADDDRVARVDLRAGDGNLPGRTRAGRARNKGTPFDTK